MTIIYYTSATGETGQQAVTDMSAAPVTIRLYNNLGNHSGTWYQVSHLARRSTTVRESTTLRTKRQAEFEAVYSASTIFRGNCHPPEL